MWNEHSNLYVYNKELIEHFTRQIGILLDNTLGGNNIPVALCCYDLNNLTKPHYTLFHRCQPNNHRDNSNRIVSTKFDQVVNFFKNQGVTTLCYAGQSFPGCIEKRALGTEQLNEHFKIKIIADCTLDLYNAHKHNYDRINEMYRYMHGKNYEYTFSTDIINEFNR